MLHKSTENGFSRRNVIDGIGINEEEHENVRAVLQSFLQLLQYTWKHKKAPRIKQGSAHGRVTASNHQIVSLSLPHEHMITQPSRSVIKAQAYLTTRYQGYTSYQLKVTRFLGLSFSRAKVRVVKQKGRILWRNERSLGHVYTTQRKNHGNKNSLLISISKNKREIKNSASNHLKCFIKVLITVRF
jgi:hypothetical protein